MRSLLVGAGGVDTAPARIAARRRFAELVIADYSQARGAPATAVPRPAHRLRLAVGLRGTRAPGRITRGRQEIFCRSHRTRASLVTLLQR